MKVFYDERQNVEHNPGISPSAGKPAKAVKSWQEKFFVELMPVVPVTPQDLAMVHDPKYVDDILNCRINNGFENKSPTVAASLLWTNGSFCSAAMYAATHKVSTVSPTSGFHHATYNEAMGFCTFNGLALAAYILKEEGLVNRVAIADLDMHYGNGTDHIILQKSWDFINHYTYGGMRFHECVGCHVLPQLPSLIHRVLNGADILFYQAGADPHVDDPFGGAMTTEEMLERDRIVFSVAKERGVPVVWNLAGGYQQDISKVLEIHDNTARMHVETYE